ncbi:hypothetical protein EK21DRAFT_65449 [Setomelanomma holmii]|uniref:CCHC-type domain-containing protein n=1 Tax=Setomelanomma holmii TaxID=210430 RepID=A0A9P4LN77_9PLEO|nr:hypothetical protein EK21DRAFT_65449 [Setomelanomma holmii]
MNDQNQFVNAYLRQALANLHDVNVIRHFVGFPLLGVPPALNEATVICPDIEWWQKEPKPTTEIGVAELMVKGAKPQDHAENILTGIQVAHARNSEHAHLRNKFIGAGDPEKFFFGTTKFVTMEEAKEVISQSFLRPRVGGDGSFQPIILVGHAVDNEFEHIKKIFGVDLRSYGTIVKVIDTQVMAKQANIRGPKGPYIGLRDLLEHFHIHIHNLHTAGNDAAGTLIAAVLLAVKDVIYPGIGNRKPPQQVRGRPVQSAIQRIMAIGKSLPPPSWGSHTFCTRCGRDNHLRQECFAKVNCSICRDSGVVRLYNAHRTHMTSKCLYQYQDLPPADHAARPAAPSFHAGPCTQQDDYVTLVSDDDDDDYYI